MPHPIVIRTRLLVVLLSVIALASWRMVAVPRPIRADEPAPRTVYSAVPVTPGTKAGPVTVPAQDRVKEVPTGPTLIGSGVNSNTGLTGTIVLNDDAGSEPNPKPTKPAESRGSSNTNRIVMPQPDAEQHHDEAARILERLERPITLSFSNAPIRDVIQRIVQLAEINVVLDETGFGEAGIQPETPIAINVNDLKLRLMLRLLLEPIAADFEVVDDVLRITSRQRVRSAQTTPSSSVLYFARSGTADLSIALDTNSVCVLELPVRILSTYHSRPSIVDVSQPASPSQLLLKAKQTGNTSFRAVDENGKTRIVRVTVNDPAAGDQGSELEHLLKRLYPTAKLEVIRIRDAMLIRGSVNDPQQVVEIVEIAEQYAPRVLNQLHCPKVPTPSAKSAVLKPPTPVRLLEPAPSTPRVEPPSPNAGRDFFADDPPRAKGIRDSATVPNRDRLSLPPGDGVRELRNDLRELHRDVRRLIELLDNRQGKPKEATSERTRPSDTNNTVTTKVYAVADLVVPVPKFVRISLNPNAWTNVQGSAKATGIGPDAKANLAVLMKQIRTEIDPESWKGTGGSGTIGTDLAQLGLIVSQTAVVHEEIAAKLNEMRRQFDVQTSCEIRFVTVPVDGNQFSSYLTIMGENQVLRTDQAQRFLEHFQGNTRTNILQAPKVTLFNGQTCEMTGGLGDPTDKLLLHTLVPDGSETVRVRMAINAGDTAEALRLASVHRVPSGDTLVVDVTEKVAPQPAASNVPSPILSKVPYVSRLFATTPADHPAPRRLLLITPRVSSTPEAEVSQ